MTMPPVSMIMWRSPGRPPIPLISESSDQEEQKHRVGKGMMGLLIMG
jgi:hypothetical protein